MKAWLIACTLAVFPFPAVSSPVTVNATDSGWYSEFGFHDASNTNYITGFTGSQVTRSFFVFDLSSISGLIVSATLRLPNFQSLSPDATETFAMFDVSTALATLTAGGSGLTGIFADLGTGTSYGSGPTPGGVTLGTTQDFGLNADGLAALNAALGGQVALGGALTTLSGQVLANEYAFGFSQDSIPQLLVETTQAVPEPGNMMVVLLCGAAVVCGSRARRRGIGLLCAMVAQAAMLPAGLFAIRFNSLFGDVAEANNPGSGVYTRVCPSNNSLSEACHIDSSYFSLITSNTPWDSLHTSSNAGSGSVSGQARAATGPAGLRARADATFLNYAGGNFSGPSGDPPVGYTSAALAWVTEDIIIRGPEGEIGQITTSFRLTGVLGSTWETTDGDPFVIVSGSANIQVSQQDRSHIAGGEYGVLSGRTFAVDYSEVHTPTISQYFLFNVPIRFSIAVSAEVYPVDALVAPYLRSEDAVADFFSTLTIAPLLITDTNSQPISNLTIESASGVLTLDSRNTSDVPEPATCATLFAALLAGAAALKRRQS